MKILIIIFSFCLLGSGCNYGDKDSRDNKESKDVRDVKGNTDIKDVVDSKEIRDSMDGKDISDAIAKAIQSTSTKQAASGAVTKVNEQVKKVADEITTEIKEKSLVHMKIISPDGESIFDLELTDGQNACDILKTAKNDAKIKSLTIKDTYLNTLGSVYVYEINGYKNNWILSLNNKSSSVGCSQVFPKNQDSIEWKFN